VEKHESSFGDFSNFNEKSVFTNGKQVSFNGEGENDTNSNDFQFADFSSFGGVDYEGNNDDRSSNDNTVKEQQLGKEVNSDEMVNNNASDNEEANEGDFGGFETNKSNGISNLTNPNPDVIPASELNDGTSGRLPLDLTNHGTKHNNDEFNSFEGFNNDAPSKTNNDLTSAKLQPDLTNHKTDSTGDFDSFKDDGFNDFTSASGNVFPSDEHETKTKSQSNECQASSTDVSKPDNNLEKCKIEENILPSTEDDDFGDFADFSNTSFNAENQSDAAFGSFAQPNEGSADHWGDSKFEAFEENSKTTTSKEAKDLSRNNSGCSRQDSGEFTAFSESTSSETKPEFQADFGAFSESNNSKKQGEFQAEFGAFSESTLSKDKPLDFGAFSGSTSSKNKKEFQADFGAFSQKTVFKKSFDQTSSNKQYAQTQLVSLHGCFQDVFVTLQHRVNDLQHVKVSGNKRYISTIFNFWPV
jgi:predicted NAD-dependent protein-ADP-ribosyltransferase YbiA (DUF1768 family)